MLQKFGFTSYESQVFEVLTASESPLDAATIVKHSQVPKSKVYEVLNRMIDKGLLLSSFEGKKKLYSALPLETTIEKLTADFQANVKELKNHEYKLPQVDDRVWTIKNESAIASLAEEIVSKAKRSIYVSGWSDGLNALLPILEKKHDEQVKVEVLSIGEMNSVMGDMHILLPDEKHDALERHQIIIIDEEELLFAGVEDGEWHGINTKSNPLVKFFTDFFYHDVALTEITKKYEQTLLQDEEIRNILMKLRY
ncbi:TrmB family transcriptional regulator [Halobacillus yeomjeoni]|uniref:TrmB family transcriptional regulator n=1 Tax=Halobacillus yeomjeoni TaxID=311194 RepID=A0A931HX17_9BACI|nr:TrmB family transcriptional regulator [Halobacillus yeomjeoni]MBH0230991.1 TrmB family transcriptional regulator [Halobacillus yeomjeoni]